MVVGMGPRGHSSRSGSARPSRRSCGVPPLTGAARAGVRHPPFPGDPQSAVSTPLIAILLVVAGMLLSSGAFRGSRPPAPPWRRPMGRRLCGRATWRLRRQLRAADPHVLPAALRHPARRGERRTAAVAVRRPRRRRPPCNWDDCSTRRARRQAGRAPAGDPRRGYPGLLPLHRRRPRRPTRPGPLVGDRAADLPHFALALGQAVVLLAAGAAGLRLLPRHSRQDA